MVPSVVPRHMCVEGCVFTDEACLGLVGEGLSARVRAYYTGFGHKLKTQLRTVSVLVNGHLQTVVVLLSTEAS